MAAHSKLFGLQHRILLTSTVFQPTIASFSNVFGRRWVTTASVIIFLLGLLICGLAQNFTLLLAGRTVQGIGGGGIIVLTQLIICDLIPLRLRGQWSSASSVECMRLAQSRDRW